MHAATRAVVHSSNDARRSSRLAHLAFWRPALRVLCYHRVQPVRRDRFTVTTEQLEEQLSYLARSGFRFIHVRDLFSSAALPQRPLILSFDDGYVDNLEHAVPVLRRHGAKATIFIATGCAGGSAQWVDGGAPLMGPLQLRELEREGIELALHSHSHRAFETMPLDEIEADVRKNLDYFRLHGIGVTPALAYPYGSRPKRSLPELARRLSALGIPLAFRLGNRLNRLPLSNRYEIQRIVVRGDAGMVAFRRRLRFGKLL
jgi:peptidoglycan/xylan/chitin deacetylase (PgdA/CDA1 family)